MVLQVRRVLSFAGTPIILEDIWLPAAPFKGLTAERLSNYQGPMYALFETEFHVQMVRAEEKIRAISASDIHATLLKVPLETPLLSVERIAYTYQNEPMELRRGYYLTDTHHYQNDMN
jgi:GntR family transcriptional regulator